MTPEKIKDTIENYPNLVEKMKKLQNMLIKFSGRESEQEIAIIQRLESMDKTIELVLYGVYEDEILTDRECCAVNLRMDGYSLNEIANFFFLSRQRIDQILDKSYKKMAIAINKQNIA